MPAKPLSPANAGPVTSPKCGTAAPAGARFCNACGTSLPGLPAGSPGPFAPSAPPSGAPPGPGAPPIDIRQRVDQDRGVLKRLQLLIPGFRGYRQGEDIREADSFLRIQVADKIKNARATVENSRQALANAGQFQVLNDLSPLIANLWQLEGEIRHAEQGYTGLSPAVRINPQQLDRLFEYDYGFAQAADELNQTLS